MLYEVITRRGTRAARSSRRSPPPASGTWAPRSIIVKLINHLEEITWEIPEMQSVEEYGKKLIEQWCSEDFRLLRRFYRNNFV